MLEVAFCRALCPTGPMTEPMVAVVIPVREDPASLDSALRLIGAQDYPSERRLVIVAVDGGDEPTMAVARRHGATAVSVVPAAGSYAARNRALDQLPDDIDIVAFTDADCLPSSGWISGHVAALENADLSGGAIRVTLSPRPHPAEFVDRMRHLQQHAYVTQQGYAATANLAVRRDVLRQLRLSDSLMTGGDADFGAVQVRPGPAWSTRRRPRSNTARRDTAALRREVKPSATKWHPERATVEGRAVLPGSSASGRRAARLARRRVATTRCG